jgi:hypothetical protein
MLSHHLHVRVTAGENGRIVSAQHIVELGGRSFG